LNCSCGKKASYRCATPRHLLSTVGDMTIERRYYACRHCHQKQTPWDAWAGVDARQVTPHARKVIVTVATGWSFDRASKKLKDICHMTVSDDTVERLCQHEGERARKWLRGEPKTVQRFAQTPGEWAEQELIERKIVAGFERESFGDSEPHRSEVPA
jgi:hypothetical protein